MDFWQNDFCYSFIPPFICDVQHARVVKKQPVNIYHQAIKKGWHEAATHALHLLLQMRFSIEIFLHQRLSVAANQLNLGHWSQIKKIRKKKNVSCFRSGRLGFDWYDVSPFSWYHFISYCECLISKDCYPLMFSDNIYGWDYCWSTGSVHCTGRANIRWFSIARRRDVEADWSCEAFLPAIRFISRPNVYTGISTENTVHTAIRATELQPHVTWPWSNLMSDSSFIFQRQSLSNLFSKTLQEFFFLFVSDCWRTSSSRW